MKNDLEEKRMHGTALFPFQYYQDNANKDGDLKILVPCHWHESVEILFVDQGEFLVIVDGNSCSGQKGDIFFFNSGQLHQLNGLQCGSSYYSFVFSMQLLHFQLNDYVQTTILEPLQKKWWFPRKLSAEAPCYASVRRELELLRSLSTERPAAYQLLIKAELYRIIAILEQHDQFLLKALQVPKEHSQTAMRLKEVLRYVAEHYQESIPLERAAEIMHMTPKYFSSFFSAAFHISFIQYLNRYRIEQACILLQTTALPVMEVGLEAGYENFSYFIRRFKEFQGCTPTDYRKRLGAP